MRNALRAAVPALLLLLPSAHADTSAPGYSIEPLLYPGRAATASLSDGRVVAFDGLRILLGPEAPAATPGRAALEPTRVLAELPAFGFPSFVVVDPTETFCVVGESLFGGLHRVDLEHGSRRLVATVPFNYDALFEDVDHLLVSAAVRGFGGGNDVLRLDLRTGAWSSFVLVPGASGPIALGPGGTLYYGTASLTFPAPPGASDVLSWSAAQLASGSLLTELDASLVAAGFEGAGDLAVDRDTGELYLAENDFATGANRVRRVHTGPPDSEVVVEGEPWQAIGNLELSPGSGGGRFRAFQPRGRGGVLRYTTTDFFSSWERFAVHTRRPRASVAGPGAQTGSGPFTWSVEGGPPGGSALLLLGPAASLQLPEVAHALGVPGDPLFLGLSPGLLTPLVGAPVALDGAGAGAGSFQNPTGVPGALVLYGLVGTGSVLGVTNRTVL